MKYEINKFFGHDNNSFFHFFIHAGFIVAILAGLMGIWISYFWN